MYLNKELEELEEIYMEQPLGYEEGGKDFVKRLKKALYGLKQVGHGMTPSCANSLT
jgi:hypothetical protein